MRYLTDDAPEGYSLGQDSASLISFHGASPIAQQAFTLTATTAVATTAFSAATAGIFGFQTSTAAIALVTRVRQLQVDLEGLVGKLETVGLLAVTGN